MYLYFAQHGEAKPPEAGPTRGLTTRGIADVRTVAVHLQKLSLDVKKTYHNDKTRARETAAILAPQLRPVKGVVETAGLPLRDDPQISHERLKVLDEETVLVGHLPHLGRLASLLLCGDSERTAVKVKMGGIVCFRRLDEDWSLEWAVSPELFN